MTKSEILAFLNANQVCHLATVEGDKPHVRGILPYKIDENGIIFHTSNTKDLHNQLQKNPNVELCFNDYKERVQVRVSGKVELIENMALKQEIVAEREFLKPWIKERGWDMLVVYRLSSGLATVWTMATNFEPKSYIQL